MKRKSTLDRIEFNTETYEILDRTSTGNDQAGRQCGIGLEPHPMLGLQLLSATEQEAAYPPPGIVSLAWNHDPIEEADTGRFSDLLH